MTTTVRSEWGKLYIKYLSYGLNKKELARMHELEKEMKGAGK